MNILESYNTISPFGNEEECAKFTIESVDAPFVLHDITTISRQYTLGFWVKSDGDFTLSLCGKTLNTTPEWKRYVITFVAEKLNLDFLFNDLGVYYIYHPKLEIGNKDTDWTEAPEDVDDDIKETNSELKQIIIENNTTLINDCEKIIFSALESYTETGDFETFKQTTESALQLMSDEMTLKFTETITNIENVNGDLQETIKKLEKHFDFTLEDGLIIKVGEKQMQLKLDNDVISFKKNGQQFGWWDGVDFHTGNIVVEVNERAQFGGFAFVPRSDGSLSFLKVGE